jgi:hypothetical protein
MSGFLDRDQLIDYIMHNPTYTDPDDLAPQWDCRNVVPVGRS